MDVLVWGTGAGASGIEDFCMSRDVFISAYVDNNSLRWGMDYNDKKIISPTQVIGNTFDYIIVANMYFEEIKLQLIDLGVNEEKILHYDIEKPKKSLSVLGKESNIILKNFDVINKELLIKRNVFKIKGFFADDVSSPISLEKQYPIIKQILDAYKSAKEASNTVSNEYRPGKAWEDFLQVTHCEFYDIVKKNNIEKLSAMLNNFCRNSLSKFILGGEDAFTNGKNYNEKMYQDFIHNFKIWMYSVNKSVDLSELEMPPIGNPYGYDVDGHIININCFWNHYRAKYCCQLTKKIKRPIIAEIGGGFGNFAYFLLRNPGEKLYMNFDLPENLLISSYYLSVAYPEKRILLYNDQIILNDETFENYDIILMPNFMLPLLPNLSVDLFINTISLSEMSYSTIKEYISQISRTCKSYFYHENLAELPKQYLGFPAVVFPVPENFQEVMVAFSRWAAFDMYSYHSYKECLYKRDVFCR